MIGTKILLRLVLAALLLAQPAHATLPPPRPAEFGAYGPMTLCEGDISIAVRADQAVHVIGPIFRIIDDEHLLAATPVRLPDSAFMSATGAVRHGVFALAGPTLAFRYSGDLPEDAARHARFAPEGWADGAVRYAIQTRTDAAAPDSMIPMLIVASPSFDGTDADKAILQQFRSNDRGPPGCIRPVDRSTGPKDLLAAGFSTSFDDPFHAGAYPPQADAGPGYFCLGGIGFAVRAGEQVRRPWRSQGQGNIYLLVDGVSVEILGPVASKWLAEPENKSDHPAGQLHRSALTFYPSRGVGPPYAPPGVREEGSWLVELGSDPSSRLQIRFPAGDKAHVGFGLIERLEFIASDDSRCGNSRH